MKPSSSNQPPTQEELWKAHLAMRMRDQAAADVQGFLKSSEIKRWCIEKGIEAMKQSSVWFTHGDLTKEKPEVTRYFAEELARRFYQFLTEE